MKWTGGIRKAFEFFFFFFFLVGAFYWEAFVIPLFAFRWYVSVRIIQGY